MMLPKAMMLPTTRMITVIVLTESLPSHQQITMVETAAQPRKTIRCTLALDT